jgi:hypothetical protein
MQQTTIVQKKRLVFASTDEAVLELLQWEIEQLSWMKYTNGCTYLAMLVGSDAELLSRLENSKLFWNYWKNCWQIRDEVFVHQEGLEEQRLAVRRDLYNMMHLPKYLLEDVRIPDSIFKNI